MKAVTHTEPKPTVMTFGNPKDSGKTDSHSPHTTIVIRYQSGEHKPAGNPKNRY